MKRTAARARSRALLPQSPDMEPVRSTRRSRKRGDVEKTQLQVFDEPPLAPPTPGYSGVPLEEGPPAKVKKELMWANKYRRVPLEEEVDPTNTNTVATHAVEPAESAVRSERQGETIENGEKIEKGEEGEDRQVKRQENASQGDKELSENVRENLRNGHHENGKVENGNSGSNRRRRHDDGPAHKRVKVTMTTPKPLARTLSNVAERTVAETFEAMNDDDTIDNDDQCARCGGGGVFLCCESCPRSFHFTCCDPPVESPPEGEWECRRCTWERQQKAREKDKSEESEKRSEKRKKSERKSEESEAKRHDEKRGSEKFVCEPQGLLAPLFATLAARNPLEFSLPRDLRESTFVGVRTGRHGEYEDDSLKEPSKNDDELMYRADGTPYLCHRCGGSGSHHRTLCPCDYCPLVWHVDCVDELVLSGRRRLGSKWRCPAHVDDLVAAPRLLKSARVVEPRIPYANILVRGEDETPRNFVTMAEYMEQEDGKDERGDSNGRFEGGEVVAPAERIVCAESLQGMFVYRLPERAILLDFVGKARANQVHRAKSLWRDDMRAYEAQAQREEFVESVTALSRDTRPHLDMDVLLRVVEKEMKEEENRGKIKEEPKEHREEVSAHEKTTTNNSNKTTTNDFHKTTTNDFHRTTTNDSNKTSTSGFSDEPNWEELEKVKRLMEAVGQDKMLEFLHREVKR